jgi:hypothetical protein
MGAVQIKKPAVKTPADLARNMKILIYGQPGAGKTFFIGSGAYKPEAFGRILVLCPDPGALTLAFDPVVSAQVDIAEIASTDDLETWYEYLKIENAKLPLDDPQRYRTLALDGLSDVAEMAMLESLAKTTAENPNRDPDMPSVDHHMRVAIIVRREVRRFRDLRDMTFIATALERSVVDQGTGKTYITPALGGKLAAEIGAYFDIIGYVYTDTIKIDGKETVVRRMRVQPNERIIAKDRTRRLGTVIENTSLPDFVERIEGGQFILPADQAIQADPKIKQKTYKA